MRQSPLLTALLLAAVLLLAATMSRAQTPPGPPQPEAVADKVLKDLPGRVALTPSETAAVRICIAEPRTQLRPARNGG
jgi:hypothetical protein